jgi:hypothetical protein
LLYGLIYSIDGIFHKGYIYIVAEQQSKHLVDSHQRFSALMDNQQFQVVYPVLPMDLFGIYVLLPE